MGVVFHCIALILLFTTVNTMSVEVIHNDSCNTLADLTSRYGSNVLFPHNNLASSFSSAS